MYSNCLIEAIKAKIKDPKNVHIFLLPKHYGGGATHFMWYNTKNGKYYHSADTNPSKLGTLKSWRKIKYTLWHEHRIKEIDEEYFNAFILERLKVQGFTVKKVKKAAKKMHLRILRIVQNYHNSNPNCEPTLPNINDVEFLRKTFRKEPQFKVVKFYSRYEREMAIMTYDELIKCAVADQMYINWKFIGIDDEEFTWLYAPSCEYAKADEMNY